MFGTIKRSISHAKIAKQSTQTHSLTFLTLVFCVVFYKFLLPERFVNFSLDGFPLSKKNHKRCQNRHDFCIASAVEINRTRPRFRRRSVGLCIVFTAENVKKQKSNRKQP